MLFCHSGDGSNYLPLHVFLKINPIVLTCIRELFVLHYPTEWPDCAAVVTDLK